MHHSPNQPLRSPDFEAGSSQNPPPGNGSGSDSDAPGDAEFLASFGRGEGVGTEWYSPEPVGYERGRTKFVVVIGTVMSGLGKGIFSSSLAKLLQDKGLSIAPIKMEGYLNIDNIGRAHV